MMQDEALRVCAAKMCAAGVEVQLALAGPVAPSCHMQPLTPPLSLAEYEAMESDQAKYLLYAAAIDRAVSSIFEGFTAPPDSQTFKLMVVGGGRGRLVHYLHDAAQRHCPQSCQFEVSSQRASAHACNSALCLTVLPLALVWGLIRGGGGTGAYGRCQSKGGRLLPASVQQ